MTQIEIDFSQLRDSTAFHEAFAKAMGFPEFYGNNGNAWIDCMSSINRKDNGMSALTVAPNQSLNSVIRYLRQDTMQPFLDMLELITTVNRRFERAGSDTRLQLTLL